MTKNQFFVAMLFVITLLGCHKNPTKPDDLLVYTVNVGMVEFNFHISQQKANAVILVNKNTSDREVICWRLKSENKNDFDSMLFYRALDSLQIRILNSAYQPNDIIWLKVVHRIVVADTIINLGKIKFQ